MPGRRCEARGRVSLAVKAFVFLNDADTEGSPLFGGEALTERPTYAELEREINRAYSNSALGA